jgi:rhodanese-related sulfurtransferase
MSEKTPIAAAEAKSLIEAGARLIDVRSAEGRAASGELADATVVAKAAIEEFARDLDKDEEIVVFCGTTAGSGPVVDWLDDNGFTNVQHVEGGFGALSDAGIAPKVEN